MKKEYLNKFFIQEEKIKKWIEDNVVRWSLILILMGILIALLQSYLLELELRTTIITIFFYSPFLLIVEYFVRKNKDYI